ncbi:hypothetical protein A0H81_10565 [Grifola frondosa]|uniref:Uncharacterized protein n=1 Tax=Grifola frondosa TaxID=5627 RepID=A0A1C7LZ68_GRIFR|nr:hypothetical protein A0H81_10565 [Grifola frondosa]
MADVMHLRTLTIPLPAPPPAKDLKDLTCSQHLFCVYTKIDAWVLKIKCDKYYLFMDMWFDKKWMSFSMIPQR